MRDKTLAMSRNLLNTKDRLLNTVQPLNELQEREVKDPEIIKILNSLHEINSELADYEKQVTPGIKDAQFLEQEVEEMLKFNKANKLDDATKILIQIDANVSDLNADTKNAYLKFKELKGLIENAKNHQCSHDHDLTSKLKQIEIEVVKIERDLDSTDGSIADL